MSTPQEDGKRIHLRNAVVLYRIQIKYTLESLAQYFIYVQGPAEKPDDFEVTIK